MRRSAVWMVAAIIGCGGGRDSGTDSTSAAPLSAGPAGGAEVLILTPEEGDTTGPDVTVTLGANGVSIRPANGTREEGIAHHHLFLDTLTTAEGGTIPPTNTRVIHIGTGDSTYTFRGLTPGPHELIAVLAFGDHSAMPARRDTVRFVVR